MKAFDASYWMRLEQTSTSLLGSNLAQLSHKTGDSPGLPWEREDKLQNRVFWSSRTSPGQQLTAILSLGVFSQVEVHS